MKLFLRGKDHSRSVFNTTCVDGIDADGLVLTWRIRRGRNESSETGNKEESVGKHCVVENLSIDELHHCHIVRDPVCLIYTASPVGRPPRHPQQDTAGCNTTPQSAALADDRQSKRL